MNVLVLGANGAVGQIVIAELLEANHEVTAMARKAEGIQMRHPQLTVVQGTPTNRGDLEIALAGQDAVLSTLGARTNKKTTLRTDVARNLVSGMRKQHVRRLVWLDAAGVGSSKQFVQRSSFLFGRIICRCF
jgi:putative NADH-flavin reductase